MEKRGNEPAFAHDPPGPYQSKWSGISVRDYFAAHCPTELAVVNVYSDRVKLAGPYPDNAPVEDQIAWTMRLEAKLRFLYADAMLSAGGK
jgi:hypothetical protein